MVLKDLAIVSDVDTANGTNDMMLMCVPKLVHRNTVLFHMCSSDTNMRYIECFGQNCGLKIHTCDMATSL